MIKIIEKMNKSNAYKGLVVVIFHCFIYCMNFFRQNISFLVFLHLSKWGDKRDNGENKTWGGRGSKDKKQVRGEIEREADMGLIDGGLGFFVLNV